MGDGRDRAPPSGARMLPHRCGEAWGGAHWGAGAGRVGEAPRSDRGRASQKLGAGGPSGPGRPAASSGWSFPSAGPEAGAAPVRKWHPCGSGTCAGAAPVRESTPGRPRGGDVTARAGPVSVTARALDWRAVRSAFARIPYTAARYACCPPAAVFVPAPPSPSAASFLARPFPCSFPARPFPPLPPSRRGLSSADSSQRRLSLRCLLSGAAFPPLTPSRCRLSPAASLPTRPFLR